MRCPATIPGVSSILLLASLAMRPQTAAAQHRDAREADAETQVAQAPAVHPVLSALEMIVASRLNPTERALLAAIDVRNTESGSVARLLLAVLDRLRPVVTRSFEAAGYTAPHSPAVATLGVRDAADARALAQVLDAAAQETSEAADTQGDAVEYSDNALRVAAGIATQVARLAQAVAAGPSDATDEDLADCDRVLDQVADILDDATVLVGRREVVRLGFQMVRGAVAAMRGASVRLPVAPPDAHLATMMPGRRHPPG